MTNVYEMIDSYLGNGGLFNPELMRHEYVRDMVLECRDELHRLQTELATAKESRRVADERVHSNWAYHRYWEEKFARHLEKIIEWEKAEEQSWIG